MDDALTQALNFRVSNTTIATLDTLAQQEGVGRGVVARRAMEMGLNDWDEGRTTREMLIQLRFLHDRMTGIQAMLNVALAGIMDVQFHKQVEKVRAAIEREYAKYDFMALADPAPDAPAEPEPAPEPEPLDTLETMAAIRRKLEAAGHDD